MGIKPDWQCEKGDIAEETLQFQILVQRSSTNDTGVWISLWKSENDKFVVSRYHNKFEDKLKKKDNIKDESAARGVYEQWCKTDRCSPYP